MYMCDVDVGIQIHERVQEKRCATHERLNELLCQGGEAGGGAQIDPRVQQYEV